MSKPLKAQVFAAVALTVAGLLALSLVASASVSSDQGSPRSLDVVILVDNSPSMSLPDSRTGAPASDPSGLRVRAARFLVDYLRANMEATGLNHRVGVVSFGGTISDSMPLRPLFDNAARDAIRAEQISFTDFSPPLRYALGELKAKSFGTGNQGVVVLLTDGHPQLASTPMSEEELDAYFQNLAPIASELQEEGAALYVLAIGSAKEDRERWTRFLPPDHFVPIEDMDEVAKVLYTLFSDLLGATAVESGELEPGSEVTVQIGPYLERVTFSFLQDREGPAVSLTPPPGAAPEIVQTGGGQDVYHLVYTVVAPPRGAWTFQTTGDGRVRYWVDVRYPALTLEVDPPVLLAQQPITISAALRWRGEALADAGLELVAEVTLPDGSVLTQTLSRAGRGEFTGIFARTSLAGVYSVSASAWLKGQPLKVRAEPVAFRVFPLPPLPTPTPTEALPIPTETPLPLPTPTPAQHPTPTPQATVPPGLAGILHQMPSWLGFVLGGVVGIALALGVPSAKRLRPTWEESLVLSLEKIFPSGTKVPAFLERWKAQLRERRDKIVKENLNPVFQISWPALQEFKNALASVQKQEEWYQGIVRAFKNHEEVITKKEESAATLVDEVSQGKKRPLCFGKEEPNICSMMDELAVRGVRKTYLQRSKWLSGAEKYQGTPPGAD